MLYLVLRVMQIGRDYTPIKGQPIAHVEGYINAWRVAGAYYRQYPKDLFAVMDPAAPEGAEEEAGCRC